MKTKLKTRRPLRKTERIFLWVLAVFGLVVSSNMASEALLTLGRHVTHFP